MAAKDIKKNYLFNLTYQILSLVVPLITAPYLSRVLQPDNVGRVSYVESVVSYFTLVAVLGISIYGQREISYVQDDLEKRSYVFWNTKALSFCTSGLALAVYVVFSLLQKENRILYLLLTLNLISSFLDITWFFQGMEDFAKTVTRSIVIKLINIAYIFLFVKDKSDVVVYVLGLGLFSALGSLSLWAYVPKYIKRVPVLALRPFRGFKTVWSLFIPTVAIQIYTVLDKTMIGMITGSSFENGYYEQAMMVSKMLLYLVTALGTVMVPRIGYLFQKGNKEDIQKYMYRGYRFVWFLGIPLCFGTMLTAGNFVPWFFGAGYDKVIPLLQVLSPLILVIGFSSVTGVQYLVPTKRQNIYSISVIVGAVTNFCLNLLLIYFFESIGAAVASVVAESAVTSVQLFAVRKELSLVQIAKEGLHYYIAGGVMAAALIPLNKFFAPSILNTALIVAVGAAVYFAVLFIERDEFFVSNVKMILQWLTEKLRSAH